MKRLLLPSAVILAASVAAPAFANSFASDRGYDDLRSYQVVTDRDTQNQNISTKSKAPQTQKEAFKDFNRKFGSPHPNFESGRR